MERKIEIEVSLKGLDVEEIVKFCQGDKNTQFMAINFLEDIELENYTLQVYYLPPYPATIPYVDLFTELKNQMLIPIPNKVLERNGYVKVELVLSKESDVITINKSFEFEVIKTINGTSLTAYPEGEIKTTIAEQIEKVKQLIAQSQDKIDEYNNNTTEKIEQYNDNSTEKLNSFNQNYDEKLKSFNQNDTQKTSVFNDNADAKLKAYNDNDVLKTQNYNNNTEEKKVEFNNNATQVANKFTDYINSVLSTATTEINQAKEGAVNEAKETIKSHVDTEVKSNIDSYVESTSKTEIDKHIETTSKPAIDNYITTKEAEIKGATYTPAIDEAGNLSFTNDKNLPNPQPVNLMGPKGEDGVNGSDGAPGAKGEKGDTPVKGVDYYTEQEKQEFAQSINSSITAEGNKQVAEVKKQGTTSLQAVTKVQSDIEALLRDQAVEGNAMSLNGKTGPQYDKEIQGVAGGYAGKFPLTSAVLDGIYLLEETGKFYVCTKAYSGSNLTAPNANFEELSVFKNRDKLSNLCAFQLVKTGVVEEYETPTEIFDFSIYHSSVSTSRLEIIVVLRRKNREWWGTRFTKFATWARQNEEITIIYDHKNGSYSAPELTLERSTKKLKIKPLEQIPQYYDIYICKFTY